jgi:hypothetical protein
MSTEFDSGGFSAVSSFFGGQDNVEETTKDTNIAPTSRKRNRLGLGAKEKDYEDSLDALESEETRKKILSIGKKKRNDDNDDDDDDEASETNQSDEEDEGGRTSIQKKTTTNSVDSGTELAAQNQVKKPKKKKKKGKKERLAEKQKEQLEKETLAESEHQGTQEEKQDNESIVNNGDPTSTDSGKRKRPKGTRSRQKNIKKDTRQSNEKPEHLRVGSKSYAGRPMTKETRQYMTLPESRTISRAKNKHQRFDQEVVTDFDASGLAVDDLLGESAAEKEELADSGELVNQSAEEKVEEPPKKKKKNATKKKRSKFKNLK